MARLILPKFQILLFQSFGTFSIKTIHEEKTVILELGESQPWALDVFAKFNSYHLHYVVGTLGAVSSELVGTLAIDTTPGDWNCSPATFHPGWSWSTTCDRDPTCSTPQRRSGSSYWTCWFETHLEIKSRIFKLLRDHYVWSSHIR